MVKCGIRQYSKKEGQMGWECPVCGRGLAIWVSECPCYKEKVVLPFWKHVLSGEENVVITY